MSSSFQRASPRRSILASAVAGGLLAFAGCAVGPDFRTPAPPPIADAERPYAEAPVPAQTASAPVMGGATQRFATGQDIPAAWWQVFHSDPLDQLIRSAMAQSPTLASAQAALRQAQENYTADSGRKLLPSVTGSLGAQRERESEVAIGIPGGATFNLYNASVNVSYTIDAFGATRRELEGLQAAVDYQRYLVEAAYLSLTANVVTTAIQEASLRAQLQATDDVVAAETKGLSVIETQVRLGAVARSNVLSQRALVAQTRATIPGLQKALAQTRHQLAVYAGRLPSDAGPARVHARFAAAADRPARLAAVVDAAPEARRAGQRSAAARGRRAGRRRDREPLSADHAERQPRLAGASCRRHLRQRHRLLEPRCRVCSSRSSTAARCRRLGARRSRLSTRPGRNTSRRS